MRLVIDARLYGIEHRGIGRYTENLLDQLVKMNSQHEFIILINPKNKQRPTNLPANFRLYTLPIRVYTLLEQIILPFVLLILKPDLVHFTHFNAPWFVPSKFILTVHDLIINHFPDSRASRLPSWLYKLKLWVYFKIIKHNLNQVEHIITVSKFAAQDIAEFYQIQPTKITPIYLSTNLLAQTNCSMNLPSKYFLYVGSAYPHKNLESLIEAFLQFQKEQIEFGLIIVGKKDIFMQDVLNSYRSFIDKKILNFWGEASDSELACLYQNCTGYSTATLMEGFGLGPLEAAQFGKLSLVSDIPVFKEVYGSDLIYFDPNKQSQIIEAFKQLVNMSASEHELRSENLHKHWATFSWQANAETVLSLYNQILTRTKN